MREERAKSDQVVAKIAGRQHGVVSAAQLGPAGIEKDAVTRRVKACRLHRIHRGVYAVGHTRLTFEGRCMAAVLALAEGAVVSHQSAAALWGMLKPHSGPIHVSVIGDGGRRKRHGITLHCSSTLVAGATTRRKGIAVTKPARSLRDLHRTVPQPVFRRAIRRALDLRLISDADLEGDADLTRSELERIFLKLCRRHRLPQPEVNARLGSYEVDFLWRDRALVVETDGFRHHSDRAAFESDRVRDADVQRFGFRVLRFTYRQVTEDRTSVVAALRDLLGERPLTPNL